MTWQDDALKLLNTADGMDLNGGAWVWAFRGLDLAREHIDVEPGILGDEARPDVAALIRVVRGGQNELRQVRRR